MPVRYPRGNMKWATGFVHLQYKGEVPRERQKFESYQYCLDFGKLIRRIE